MSVPRVRSTSEERANWRERWKRENQKHKCGSCGKNLRCVPLVPVLDEEDLVHGWKMFRCRNCWLAFWERWGKVLAIRATLREMGAKNIETIFARVVADDAEIERYLVKLGLAS